MVIIVDNIDVMIKYNLQFDFGTMIPVGGIKHFACLIITTSAGISFFKGSKNGKFI